MSYINSKNLSNIDKIQPRRRLKELKQNKLAIVALLEYRENILKTLHTKFALEWYNFC